MEEINKFKKKKKKLSSKFEIKYLAVAKKILGIKISKDRQKSILQPSQEEYS